MALLQTLTIFSLLIVSTSAYSLPAIPPVAAPISAPHHPGHHRTPKPVAKPPTYPKTPVAKPPTSLPAVPVAPVVKPPTYTPTPMVPAIKKYAAVQGMVYCKSCNFTGVNTLVGASAIDGAKVILRCIGSKNRYPAMTKNGYFFIEAKNLTASDVTKCRAYLPKKSRFAGPCTIPTNLNGGQIGVVPVLEKIQPSSAPLFTLFTVGPFAYEQPKCKKY